MEKTTNTKMIKIKPQKFAYATAAAKNVQLVGDFTNWQERPIPLRKEPDGVWHAAVPLEPGTHYYRFLVDGHRRTIMGKLLLNDPETGLELADLDATHITAYRTGAAGGIAVSHLARMEATRLGLVGAGNRPGLRWRRSSRYARSRPVTVYSRTPARALALKEELEKNYGSSLEVVLAETLATAVRRQDIVVTTTPSTAPLVRREWVEPGTHINAVGADSPGKQELDPAILAAAKVVVDDWAQCKDIGEINVPLGPGGVYL